MSTGYVYHFKLCFYVIRVMMELPCRSYFEHIERFHTEFQDNRPVYFFSNILKGPLLFITLPILTYGLFCLFVFVIKHSHKCRIIFHYRFYFTWFIFPWTWWWIFSQEYVVLLYTLKCLFRIMAHIFGGSGQSQPYQAVLRVYFYFCSWVSLQVVFRGQCILSIELLSVTCKANALLNLYYISWPICLS